MSGEITEKVTCFIQDENSVICNGTLYAIPEPILTVHDTWFWIYLGIYCALVLFAGLMSGLTLGLLSLDTTSLRVIMQAGTPKQQKHAKRILPLVKRHHILLVTLLFANAAAVESMPIFLDRISDPITAIAVSVTAVLLFGEVFPQALCSRYGLAIGAFLSPLVYFLMVLFFIISYPLAKLLDCLLGTEHGTFYRRSELKALVDLHGSDSEGHSEGLSHDEITIIKGALELKDKTVGDAMVPLESVFMLSVTDFFDRETMKKVLQASHSRIPVYQGSKKNVLGIILVKTIILLDPKEATPVRTVMMNHKCFRPATFIQDTMPMYDLLNDFQTGKSHLSIVLTSSHESGNEAAGTSSEERAAGEAVGIITLEDVLEELLQEEIIDETDVYVDVHKKLKVVHSLASLFRSTSTYDPQSRVGSRVASGYPTSDGEYLSEGSHTSDPYGKHKQKTMQAVARQVSDLGKVASSISEHSDSDPLLP